MSDSAEEPTGRTGSEVDGDSSENDLDALVAGFEVVPSRATAPAVGPAEGLDFGDAAHVAEEAGEFLTPVWSSPTDEATGVGAWFQPVAGGVLPVPAEVDGLPGAALITGARTTLVHAPSSLAVESVAGDAIVTRTYDGLRIRLAANGSDSVAWCVVAGDELAPGGILGSWSADSSPARALVVSVLNGQGDTVDAVEMLTGLPDPGELGLTAAASGPAVPLGAATAPVGSRDRAEWFDPFDLDLELGVTVVPPA
jgi:hypothetical protein